MVLKTTARQFHLQLHHIRRGHSALQLLKRLQWQLNFVRWTLVNAAVLLLCLNNEKVVCVHMHRFIHVRFFCDNRRSCCLSCSRRTCNHNNSSLIHLHSPSQFRFTALFLVLERFFSQDWNGREAILGLSRLDCPSAKTGGTVNGGAFMRRSSWPLIGPANFATLF